jgi:hypothetical protein
MNSEKCPPFDENSAMRRAHSENTGHVPIFNEKEAPHGLVRGFVFPEARRRSAGVFEFELVVR